MEVSFEFMSTEDTGREAYIALGKAFIGRLCNIKMIASASLPCVPLRVEDREGLPVVIVRNVRSDTGSSGGEIVLVLNCIESIHVY